MQPPTPARRLPLVLGGALLIFTGCGSEDTPPDVGTNTGGSVDDSASVCSDDPRVVAYTQGLSAKSESSVVSIAFQDASPAPPEKGVNTWEIELSDELGEPLLDEDVSLSTLMPDHGHSSSVTPSVTNNGDGSYVISNVVFPMPGVWEVTFHVARDGGEELISFSFCIDG